MSAMGRWWRKLSVLRQREQFGGELDEEMQFHCEQMAREFEEQGMSREEARTAALRQFGNATRMRERSHEVMGFRWESVAQDVRFALRQMGRNPGFAVTAMLMLALGMGASTAIFGFVDAALIQPLPYGQPNRLLAVDESAAAFPRTNLSRYDYEDWKRMNHTLESLDVYNGFGFLLRMGPVTEPVPATRVSAGFFHTLGVQPILGRDFRPGEDQPGQPKIVMLPYGTWKTRFGGRRDVIGQQVSLSGDEYTIVGVLPRSFAFAPRASAQFWVPLLERNGGCEQRRSCHNLDGIARLKDGVTEQQALADLKNVAAQLSVQYPDSNTGQGASVEPLTELIVGKIQPILLTLLSGAGLLLLIACVNVASLLLVRAEKRRREIAVRGALGATPARLVRQFVTEGLLLAVAGCAGGILIAGGLMTLLTGIVPKGMAEGMPFLSLVGLNAHTAVFAAGVAVLAAVLLAAIPALRMQLKDLHEGLGEGARGTAGRLWRRLGANLVVVELAVAVVLLAGAGLLGKSLYRLLHVEMGFDTTHLATAYVMATGPGYAKPEQDMALYREIERRVGALPGVTGVAITSDLPIQCDCDTDWIRIPGKPYHGEHNDVLERDVNPEYLGLLRVKLLEGRMFTEQDDPQHPSVTIINETFAKKYFPGEDPVGKRVADIKLSPGSMRQIVGVIADFREGALDDPPVASGVLPDLSLAGNEFLCRGADGGRCGGAVAGDGEGDAGDQPQPGRVWRGDDGGAGECFADGDAASLLDMAGGWICGDGAGAVRGGIVWGGGVFSEPEDAGDRGEDGAGRRARRGPGNDPERGGVAGGSGDCGGSGLRGGRGGADEEPAVWGGCMGCADAGGGGRRAGRGCAGGELFAGPKGGRGESGGGAAGRVNRGYGLRFTGQEGTGYWRR